MAVTVVPEGRLTAMGMRLWVKPAAISVMAGPKSGTGVLLLVVVPLPSWPEPLRPQASTWPPDVSARGWYGPPATAATVVPAGRLTWTAGLLSVVVPLPSWPLLLKPQASTRPGVLDVPAAWVCGGDPETIVPDRASIAATPRAARARSVLWARPLRAVV